MIIGILILIFGIFVGGSDLLGSWSGIFFNLSFVFGLGLIIMSFTS